VASRPITDLVEQFDVDDVRVEVPPEARYNIAPTEEVLGVRQVIEPKGNGRPGEGSDGEGVRHRRLGSYRWGLVPSWAKDPSVGARAFNARAETLSTKPMFRNALERRRLIIPADAFYEWKRVPSGSSKAPRRLPYCFKAADGSALGFAGLYEVWRQPGDGPWLASCSIVTTPANHLVAPVHDRMPLVLLPEQYDAWLQPGPLAEEELRRLLTPTPDDFLVCYRVSNEVSNSNSDGPQLVEPLEEADDIEQIG
jgi:putative SOS response-associated peptidase YedK